MLECLLKARHLYAYGEQIDTLDHKNIIAWQHLGDTEHQGSSLAILISNGDYGKCYASDKNVLEPFGMI